MTNLNWDKCRQNPRGYEYQPSEIIKKKKKPKAKKKTKKTRKGLTWAELPAIPQDDKPL